MKTPEEIKNRIKCYLKMCDGTCDTICVLCEVYEAGYAFNAACSDVLAYIRQLESRLAQVERERDAAVQAASIVRLCSNCKHYDVPEGVFPCSDCAMDRERKKPFWKWRGVCENTKEEK